MLYSRLDFLSSTVESENDIAIPPAIDQPSPDGLEIDDPPPLPLTIWALNHEVDPNAILDLCTLSLQCTNHLRRIRHAPRFLNKRVSSMISPASFKRAQKLKRHLSVARLVLSSSTIRSLTLIPLHSSEPAGPLLNDTLISPIITPYISTVLSTLDKDADTALPVSAVNCGFPPSSTSALSVDNDKYSSYTFTIRTVLDGHFSPDSENCFTIHTNSPLLFTAEPFQFTSDRPSPNFKFILSKFLTFFFYRQSRIPSRARRKYFNRLRQLLRTQRVTSLARWTSSHRNNRCTRTFVQFRYQQSCFDLGVYYGCPFCKLPAAYVISNFRHACHIHDKKLIQTPSPSPAPPLPYLVTVCLEDKKMDANNQQLTARTLVSYSAHSSISHPTKKQLARQQRHQDILTDRHKFSRHIVYPDLLDSSMWMATKDPAVVIPPASYKLTMSTTDASLILSQVVLNPSAIIADNLVLNKPTSGPFVSPNCPTVDQFQVLGLKRPIIDMVRRLLSNSASLYVPTHNFLWLMVSKHNISSVPQQSLRDAVHSIITTSASSSSFLHLWNDDTRFFFKFGRVKPCDILMLFDVCAPWFDSHTYPDPSNPHPLWELPTDFVRPIALANDEFTL
ncbi:hypothetical protein C1646_777696 [Rhizophagus diaphanus]|nr:hypothetical protein C1646_777696 [Rhizophagus diaphanus] [Rhizophagus sp. MUCL 43196]